MSQFPALVLTLRLVYGSENVTSGASSDIRSATATARDMVTVIASFSFLSNLSLCVALGFF
jgi:ATP-dependent Zn protease